MLISFLYKHIRSALSKKPNPEGQKTVSTPQEPCHHRSESSDEPCLDCKAERRAATKYRWTIILGLLFPFTLQALDTTIIASALPWIASDFHEVSQLNWIVSAFNLTSAAFIPCWSQLADVFGRTASLAGAMICMIVGSALCAGAPTSAFPVLLLGRALQGVASAGLNVVTRAILADKVSLQENAKNWALFALVGGVSYALGPVIGGYLTQADWRWCFGINLPVAAFGLLIVFFVLRKHLLGPQPILELDETVETGRKTKFLARVKTIDMGGQLLFIFGFGSIILGLTWGGATYPWASAAVIVPLILGVVLCGCFVFWEKLLAPGNTLSAKMPWQRAMIPWKLMCHRDVRLLFFCECCTGIGMYAVLYFCSIYFIAVRGYTSDEAGVQLLYFTPGLGAGVIICSLFCNRWPRMTFYPIIVGTITESIGLSLLAWSIYVGRKEAIFGMMALVGCGCGIRFMASPLHCIGLFRKHRASIIGLITVALPLGGTIGLTIMSTVFNNTSGLDANKTNFSQIHSEPEDIRAQAIHDAKMGVTWAFVAITPIVVLSVLCAACLGNVKLGRGPPDEHGPTDIIVKGSYLLSLLRGDKTAEDTEKGESLESMQSTESSNGPTPQPLVASNAENTAMSKESIK